MHWGSRIYRTILSILLLNLLALSFPHPAIARPSQAITLHFEIASVKRDASVTIRTKDFPVRTRFTAYMDVAGKKAFSSGGTAVGEFNSDKGGILEQTFPIPDALKGQIILVLRVESIDGYTANKWFFNDTAFYTLPDPQTRPSIDFTDVKKNTTVTVQGKNLPPNTAYWV